jgi:hypothetical protein
MEISLWLKMLMYFLANVSFQNYLIPSDPLHLVKYLLLWDKAEKYRCLKRAQQFICFPSKFKYNPGDIQSVFFYKFSSYKIFLKYYTNRIQYTLYEGQSYENGSPRITLMAPKFVTLECAYDTNIWLGLGKAVTTCPCTLVVCLLCWQ